MGTTVIDALLVTLGLDASNFSKGAEAVGKGQKKISDQAGMSAKAIDQQEKKLADAQKKRAQELEARSKQIAIGISKIRNEALALLSLFTAGMGLKNFATNTISTASGLDRMSSNLAMSAKDLSMWQLAAKNAGATAESMTSQLKAAASDLAALPLGLGPSASLQASFRYGVKQADLKDANTLILKQADILKKAYDVNPTKAAEMAKQMGISEDAFLLLKKGSAAVQQQRQAQAALAEELANASKPAEELRQKMDALGNSFDASGVKILTKFTPALEGALSTLKNISGFLNDDEAMDHMSERIAHVLAFFGNKEAQEILGVNEKATPNVKKGWGGLRLGKKDDLDADDLANGRKPISGSRTSSGKITMAPGAAPSAAAIPGTNKNLPRGLRNNNPGNIEYGPFAKRHGATGSDGRFAIFPTMEAGQAAQQALLGGYLASGSNTIRKAISKWAPSSENNTEAYVNAVSKQMGVGPDQTLKRSDIPALADAIGRHENGKAYTNAMGAVDMVSRASSASRAGNGGNTSTSTTEVKVGTINVQTQATDAKGIAKSIGDAVTKHGFVSQANTGLS